MSQIFCSFFLFIFFFHFFFRFFFFSSFSSFFQFFFFLLSSFSDIVKSQQRRHDHLRPITGAPALNGIFLGAANFVEHVDLGYANVAGAPPTKIHGKKK